MSYEEEKQDRKIDQLGAEIERLRARDKQMAEAIVSIANRTKRYVLSTHAITEAVFDEADSLVEYCEKLEKIVIARDARIKELEELNTALMKNESSLRTAEIMEEME